MAGRARAAPGGLVYHVLDRAAGRTTLFRTDADFAAFERVMLEAHERFPLRVLAYCVMSNHWHFVAWPRADGELTAFFRWPANTHAVRWRVARRRTVGHGHLYQGRFKSFPIQRGEHLLTACRHVERNALSAGVVTRAEAWRWGSLWARDRGRDELKAMLAGWPVDRPDDWAATVNTALTPRELERLAASEARGRPFGDEQRVRRTMSRLGLTHTVRREGRPAKTGKIGAPGNEVRPVPAFEAVGNSGRVVQ
jgi:putative transposase